MDHDERECPDCGSPLKFEHDVVAGGEGDERDRTRFWCSECEWEDE